METKIIKVDKDVHEKAKKDARLAGMTLMGYIRKLVEQGLVK